MRAEEAERVAPIDLGYYGCDFVQYGGGSGIEDALMDARHVGRNSVDAVGVDAAEVGEDEAFCDYGCVGRWDAIAFENALHE